MLKKIFSRVFMSALLFSVISVAFATNNYSTLTPYPDTIYIRKSCGTMVNCGTTVDEARIWMDAYKKPSDTSPLLVDIGPGTFNGYFVCNGYSRLSIKGAGPGQTVLTGTGRSVKLVIKGINCTDLNVQDLSITTSRGLSYVTAVAWDGSGSSTWTNVQVDNDGTYAWTESYTNCPVPVPVHKWFASMLSAATSTYFAQCSDNWFFGSRLVESTPAPEGGYQQRAGSVIEATRSAKFHVYGSNITMQLPDGFSADPITDPDTGTYGSGFAAVKSDTGAEVHIHGTGIDVIGSGSVNAIAALLSTGGMIHANETAYNLDGKGGPIARIINFGGDIRAPYFWEAHDVPPAVTSVTGADTAVVTNNTDGHPHLVIYDSACTSKWYDTATKTCR